MRIPYRIAVLALVAATGTAQKSGSRNELSSAPLVMHMTAKDFEFDPPEIHVRQGATVELRVVSSDHTHGIHVNPFPDGAKPSTPPGLSFPIGEDCYKLKKDVEVTVLFTAQDPGTYSFKCCKLCGSGHKKMVGKLVVDPAA
jgi:cytochrome c oxidase subunit II